MSNLSNERQQLINDVVNGLSINLRTEQRTYGKGDFKSLSKVLIIELKHDNIIIDTAKVNINDLQRRGY